MSGPYSEAAWLYRQAGWRGVLPLPPTRKGPPPGGFTGWAGVDPSGPDVQAWIDGPEGAGNIGLHLGDGVYGLDVDAYTVPGGTTPKGGAEALAKLVEQFGPLPPTWVVSSRDDGVSGIRLYRAALPLGRVWVDEPGGHGAGIEAIHRGHRYAVVWPSVHPDTGRTYAWHWEGDEPPAGGPAPSTLPELPAAWVEALSRPGEVREGAVAGHDEAVRTVSSWREGEACPRVASAAGRAMSSLAAAALGDALHPAATAGLWELCSLGHEGHAGVRRALAEHYQAHLRIREGRGDQGGEGEWWRLLRGAIGKLPAGGRREVCDCDLLAGVGVTFDAGDLGWQPVEVDEFEAPAAGGDPAVDAALSLMLTPAQLADMPQPVPLVAGLLYRDTLAWLIGPPGSFKSFLALDLAAAVAEGREWAGRRTGTGGGVLYLAAEGVGGLRKRKAAWELRNGRELPERLRFLLRAVQANSDGWDVLVRAVARLAPALVVIDTQARVSVGVKENDNTEIGALIARLDQLRTATRACVLVVHHTGRQGTHARGGSAIDGAQDTELRVERVGGEKSRRVRLVVDKQKDGPDDVAIELEMESVELPGEVDEVTGEPLTSLVVSAAALDPFPVAPWREVVTPNQALLLDILREMFSEQGGAKADVFRLARERGVAGSPKSQAQALNYAWNALIKKDLIERVRGTQRFVIGEYPSSDVDSK